MIKNRLDTVLVQCKNAGRKMLIPYLTAGDGGFALTEEIILAMAENGADGVVLGVPFSDPIAEAPVAQQASERALAGGASLAGIFDMVKQLRTKTDIPIVLMLYINTIFRTGKEGFFAKCKECGIEGVMVPDMPFEEKDEIQNFADAAGIHNISLVTAASEGRIKMIADDASGFLYCVAPNQGDGSVFLDQAKAAAEIPVIAEAEISDLELVLQRLDHCDGILLSSAIVELVEKYGAETAEAAALFVKKARAAMDMQ
ncbi:MAG: tryptophan synthase subunit alpha [Ruminococcus sp.]|nr:tryptophan synthase subunit alpha [Ruminococcus sp.]